MVSRRELRIVLAIACILLASDPACAESLNLKLGAWEVTNTHTITGSLVPATELAKLPPDQRAALESAMQAQSGRSETSVSKSCVTQEDLDQNRMFATEDDDNCTRKVLSQSTSKLVVEMTCPPPNAATSHLSIEAKSPESMVASMDMESGDGSGKMQMSMTGRWLGASCDGIEDDE